ncbi:hypothetical protein KGP36_05420 [Patescibacteria group bacterium]|nr:hypothetical protein [Patescibacteria group bacterium]
METKNTSSIKNEAFKELADKLWTEINQVTWTEEWETEDPYSERPIRHRLHHRVKDDKETCVSTIERALNSFLEHAQTAAVA